MVRKRYGQRRHTAQFQRHNGSQYETGNPTYDVPNHWDTIIPDWPCELLSTSGGEMLRGRHVLFGEYFGAEGVTADMRVIVGGQTLGIVAAYDPDGTSMEMRVEAKQET